MNQELTTFQSFTVPQLANFRPGVFVRRSEIPKALLAAEAGTYGWDSVNCVRLPIVNKVLKDSGDYPGELSIVLNKDENWKLSTSFDAWQITSGGSGSILMMKLPITSSTMNYGDNSFKLENGYANISIKLRYISQSNVFSSSVNGSLLVEKLLADSEGRTSDDPAVVINKISYGQSSPADNIKSLYSAALSLLLNENLDKFSHIFSVVNLNQKAAQKEFFWLKPTYTSYAYFQGLTDEESYFAVLNQTENRGPGGLTNQVSGSAIPAGADGSILISPKLFLQHIVLPSLTRAFPNAGAETFVIKNLGEAIENTENVDMGKIRVGAVDYTPILEDFVLQIVGDEIQIHSKVSIYISPGIYAFVRTTYYYVIGLTEKPDGSQTLDFEPSREPIIETWHEVASWVLLTELIVGIIGGVVGAVVAEKITKVVTKIIVSCIIIVVAGVAAATPQFIADVLAKGTSEALPAIGPMVDDASAPVEWPQSSGFHLVSSELNGSLQLGGMLKTLY